MTVCDSFYITEDNDIHRVASISYGLEEQSVRTFCREEFKITDKQEIINVPIRLLRTDEVCVACERNYSYIEHNQFNTGSKDKKYKFFIRASIKQGENNGSIIQETVNADTADEAKEIVAKLYKNVEIHKFHHLSRCENYGEWIVLTD